MSIRRLVVLAVSVAVASGCMFNRGGGTVDPDVTVPDSFVVVFETTRGRFDVMARREWGPAGVDRFYQLVNDRFYDETGFFRVVKGFVAQFGLAADPAKTKAWRVRRLADETLRHGNVRGAVAFARGGPGTRTTQLYINLVDNARLDTANTYGFPAIAEVVRGMSVVDSIYSGYNAARGGPPVEGGSPSQDSISNQGTAYLKRHFPKMDYIESARVVREWRAP